MAGQTLHDRFEAAKHTIYGQNVERAICKATTEEIIGPKKKHLDYLIHCTNEPNVSVPEMCNFLILRTQQSSWVVVFKSLITTHHLMCYGNERFIQCMATNSCSFHLSTFVDRGGSQGYDMSIFVRRYAKYLNTKTSAYRFMGADFCKLKRGKEEGILRNMSTESLLKTLPVLHEQLDTLLDFDCNPDDLTNGAMNSCFVLLYRDLIQLFAAYNDGIINLFEKYFTMSKKHCKGALDIYKKFIVAMDKVSDFLKVAEVVGIDRGSIPDLTKAPSSLLEEMENHLTYLEGKKSQGGSSKPESVQKAPVSSPNAASFSNAHEINGLTVDESIRRAVEEEAVIMNQLKEQRLKELATKQSSVPVAKHSDLQEKAASLTSTSSECQENKQKNSPPFSSNEDLMSLNILPSTSIINNQQQLPSNSPVFDPFGEMLQPESQASQAPNVTPKEEDPIPEKLISSDLDSSLQSLVQNLDMNGPKTMKKPDGQQWASPKVQTRTGGVNWNPPTVPLSNYPPNLYVTQIQPMPPGVMNLSAYGQPVAVMPTMVTNQPYMVPGVSHVTVTPFGIVPRAPMSASPQHPQVFYGQSSPQHSGSSSNEKTSVDPFGVL